jgi:hypothetical protein
MTFISKTVVTLIISVMGVFVFHKPPTPTPAEKVVHYEYTVRRCASATDPVYDAYNAT